MPAGLGAPTTTFGPTAAALTPNVEVRPGLGSSNVSPRTTGRAPAALRATRTAAIRTSAAVVRMTPLAPALLAESRERQHAIADDGRVRAGWSRLNRRDASSPARLRDAGSCGRVAVVCGAQRGD